MQMEWFVRVQKEKKKTQLNLKFDYIHPEVCNL